MKSLHVLNLSTGLLLFATEATACPVPPPPDALVGLGLSSVREDVEVRTYGDGDERSCFATLDLVAESVPSLGLVPRPREIAAEIAPAARALGAETCTVRVLVFDDEPTFDERDADRCWRGTYRYDGDLPHTDVEDATCW